MSITSDNDGDLERFLAPRPFWSLEWKPTESVAPTAQQQEGEGESEPGPITSRWSFYRVEQTPNPDFTIVDVRRFTFSQRGERQATLRSERFPVSYIEDARSGEKVWSIAWNRPRDIEETSADTAQETDQLEAEAENLRDNGVSSRELATNKVRELFGPNSRVPE